MATVQLGVTCCRWNVGVTMVDCFDRIAVQMTEIALEQVRTLAQSSTLAAVTLRTPSGGQRYHITVSKFWPAGQSKVPAYSWFLVEVTEGGVPLTGGIQAASADHTRYADPEDAYWAAVDALASETHGQRRA